MYKLMKALNMTKKPASKDWQRWHIIGAVRETGTTLQQLSMLFGYTRTVLGTLYIAPIQSTNA